jgi:hypothetical protein
MQNITRLKTKMLCSHNADRHGERSGPPLLVCDLRAQLAPLDSYGPSGLGVVLAHGVHALIRASGTAVAALRPSHSQEGELA